MELLEKLMNIQSELKAPKTQYNAFGKYAYRNCEDILEAVKPLLIKYKATVFLSDTIEYIGTRYYVKATVKFYDCEKPQSEPIVVTAFAREEESKKGADGSQVTGASSSYARKYALNGLFDIDDTKDSDTTNTQGKETTPAKDNATPKAKTPRERLIAKLHEKGIDVNIYAQEKNLTTKTTAEEFEKLLKELEG